MKFTIMAISALVAAITFAETEATQKKITLAPGEFEARAKKNHERRTGGTVRKPGSAQGTVLFLNAQSRVSLDAMKIAFKEIDENIHPMYKVVSVDSVNLLNPKKDIEKYGVAPLESCRDRIRDYILSGRKRDLINGLEQELLEDAVDRKQFVIY